MEEERQKKIFLMKVGIGFLMVLLITLWVFNLKNVWRGPEASIDNQPVSTSSEWLKIKADLTKTISELSVRLDKIETKKQAAQEIASSSLIQELIKEAERLATSSASSTGATSSLEVATSTVVNPSIKNNNCPAYINCMPTIGEARPCQIPAGCEGVTQIAY